MKVKCIYNTGEVFKNYKVPDGYSLYSQYALEIEKEYLVMGICTWKKLMLFLIDDGGIPSWYPFLLFQISDSKINLDWHIRTFNYDENESLESIWGYYELCFEEGYFDALTLSNTDALRTYFKYKIAWEKMEES